MFLVFALLLLSLGVGLFLNVYASFFPFMQSISHISDYNIAYYSAISAVERGIQVAKYREPGFVGSGGFLDGTGRGPLADQNIFFISDDSQSNRWTVNSRTTSIPVSGEGNIDPFLATGDSTQYNALGYATTVDETFLLSIDNTTGAENYYSGNWRSKSEYTGGSFSGELRLPPFVFANFATGDNVAKLRLTGTDSDDEVKLRWEVDGFCGSHNFDIIHTQEDPIDYDVDNALRASLLNTQPYLPLVPEGFTFVRNGVSLTGHNVHVDDRACQEDVESKPFTELLSGGNYTGLALIFGLVSMLRSVQGSIYPYLEYRFTFPNPVADKYFTIVGHGRNRYYDVEIHVKKPTVKGTVGGDFTVIF